MFLSANTPAVEHHGVHDATLSAASSSPSNWTSGDFVFACASLTHDFVYGVMTLRHSPITGDSWRLLDLWLLRITSTAKKNGVFGI